MIRDIILHPNDKILRQKSKAVDAKVIDSKRFKGLVNDLVETMLARDGLGLAAPQIGVNDRVVAINTKDGPIVLINPVIKKKSWRKEIEEEGCLSVPKVFGLVKRSIKIEVEVLTPKKSKKKISAKGLFARVIQHEVDHLDGILFIDKAKNIRSYGDD